MFKFFRLALVAIALVSAALLLPSHVAIAAGGGCTASPGSAPVGTTFQLVATGFDPNVAVWTYAVDPSGTAFSDPKYNAFGGGNHSDGNGAVAFSFATRFNVLGYDIARAFGKWTLVVQETAAGGVIVHQVNCIVNVLPNGAPAPTGATMVVSPKTAGVGSLLIIYGSGFNPGDIVNMWLSPPPGCASFGFDLPSVLYEYSTASAYTLDDVRADGGGQFAYRLPTDRYFFCPGDWAVSGNAPGSNLGAIAYFKLTAQGGAIPGQPMLMADSTDVVARGGSITLSGQYYRPNSVASCWLTRPDNTVRDIGDYPTDASGNFSFTYHTGYDNPAEQMHYSEGAFGTYNITCRDNETGLSGTAYFSVGGLLFDP